MARQVEIAHESSGDRNAVTAAADAARIAYPGDAADDAIDDARFGARREGIVQILETEAWLQRLASTILAGTAEIEEV